MRVIVCGCRDWADEHAVFTELSRCYVEASRDGKRLTVVHGCAPGADSAASSWCMQRDDVGVREERHEADWNKYGKVAGPLRNAKMASAGADLCLAFWDGKSPGTANMIRTAVECGITVRIVARKENR